MLVFRQHNTNPAQLFWTEFHFAQVPSSHKLFSSHLLLAGSWWPLIEDMVKENVPIYRSAFILNHGLVS